MVKKLSCSSVAVVQSGWHRASDVMTGPWWLSGHSVHCRSMESPAFTSMDSLPGVADLWQVMFWIQIRVSILRLSLDILQPTDSAYSVTPT